MLSSEVDAGRPTLTFDLCAPGTGCSPELAYLRAATSALALPALSPGQFVEVRWDNTLAYCGATLEVRNVASWAGASNPVRTDNALLFAVARRTGNEGAPAVLAEPELTVSYVPLGCGWRTNSGFPADLYTLTATPAALDGGSSSGGFGLGEGQSVTLSVGSLRYRVENRRSCHSGAFDESDRFLVAVSLVP